MSHRFVVVFVHHFEWREDVGFVGLHDLATHHHLVQNEVCPLQVEHDVQLTHILEILVQSLHQGMDELLQKKHVRDNKSQHKVKASEMTRMDSSLTLGSTPTMKNNEAYRR